jgi:type II secretory pathway component GspD/PulD (secretin)
MDDVQLADAIKNLARQAGINYMLDPRMSLGQPGPNGEKSAQPTVSIRWENITAEQALEALLNNYGLQMITDPKTKIARITVKDPAAPDPIVSKVVQLQYSDPNNMVAAVQAAFTDKRSHAMADIRTSQILIAATDKEQESVAKLIEQLDKPTRQVLIETRLIEISSNPSTKKGMDWTGTLSGQNLSFGNGVLSGSQSFTSGQPVGTTVTDPGGRTTTTTTPGGNVNSSALTSLIGDAGLSLNTAKGLMPSTFFLNADGVRTVLSFLNSSFDAQVISTPRIVTLDNQTATISVTRGFPIFATTAGTQGSPGGSSVTYSNIGTILEVTPRISANDRIWLKVVPEVSSFFGTVTKTVAGTVNQADVFDCRKIETQVLIPNAHTLVMGGMVKNSPSASFTKVPLLGDIPLLGHAFRSESKQLDNDNLLIFITPTIVQEDDFHPTDTDFLKSEPFHQKKYLNPDSIWDGARPRDWSEDPKAYDSNSSKSDQAQLK